MRYLPIALLLLTLTACQTTKKIACPPDVICTRIFKSVIVKIVDTTTRPIQLDEAYTINVSTGETIHYENTGEVGYYTVLDDSYQKKMPNSTLRFQFVGMKNGERLVQEDYRITADCCHIDKLGGRDSVVIKRK